MCILILAAEELLFEQRIGHDIRVLFDDTKSASNNFGPGTRYPGGPFYIFHGVVFPDLVASSTKEITTSSILTAIFKGLYVLEIYCHTPTLKTFALFDAHVSRLQVPLLRYINIPTSR